MGWKCSRNGSDDKHIEVFDRTKKRRNHLGETDAYGRTMSKQVLKK
jgi:hypothetical protein